LIGKRLLPDRVPPADRMLARPTGSQLEDLYQLGERLWELRILPDSVIDGKTLAESRIGENLGLTVAGVIHNGEALLNPSPELTLHSGDVLLTVGPRGTDQLDGKRGVAIAQETENQHVSPRGIFLAEVILSPHSKALGKTLKEMNFRQVYGATAIALWRKNRSYRTNVGDFALEVGDSLLVMGTREQFSKIARDPDFIILEASLGDQPVMRRQGFLALAILFAGILLSILGMPVFLAMLGCVLALVLLRITSIEEAYRSIEWQAIFLVGGMYSVSLAMAQTGLSASLGALVVRLAQTAGPLGLAAGAFLLTAFLTQLMGGQVTALVTGPVMISAAIAMQVNPQAIAVATAIGCSASFLTPFAHPVNILMIAPANYTFSDFLRVGLPLTLVSFVMLLIGMKLFWGL
jgi:di/tricarboxylate transporter